MNKDTMPIIDVPLGLDPTDANRANIAAALGAAYPDSYAGFTETLDGTVAHFIGNAPDDLDTTLQPFTVSATDKAVAQALAALTSDPALDDTTRQAVQQAIDALAPST